MYVSADSWQWMSAGAGAKGPRLYDWVIVQLVPPPQLGFEQALLIRRPLDAPSDPQELVKELVYYLTFGPAGTFLETLVAVAGRWTIEGSFATAKGEVGLDKYEVLRYPSWYWHITLAMLALAYLAVVRSRLSGRTDAGVSDPKRGPPWLSSCSSTAS